MDHFAQMHNDYLDPDRYFGNQEQPIQLHEDGTLKGYGRRQHGLNGKDADLDASGQNKVKSAYWFAHGTIQIVGTRYANVCPPLCCQNNRDDECWDVATEIICDCPIAGEWSDDYWSLSDGDYTLTVTCEWNDSETDEQNIARACEVAFDAINIDSEEFEQTITGLHEQIEALGDDHEKRIREARLERRRQKAARRK